MTQQQIITQRVLGLANEMERLAIDIATLAGRNTTVSTALASGASTLRTMSAQITEKGVPA
jgi:hypothetical protein